MSGRVKMLAFFAWLLSCQFLQAHKVQFVCDVLHDQASLPSRAVVSIPASMFVSAFTLALRLETGSPVCSGTRLGTGGGSCNSLSLWFDNALGLTIGQRCANRFAQSQPLPCSAFRANTPYWIIIDGVAGSTATVDVYTVDEDGSLDSFVGNFTYVMPPSLSAGITKGGAAWTQGQGKLENFDGKVSCSESALPWRRASASTISNNPSLAFTPANKAELVAAVFSWKSGSLANGDISTWNTSLITDMSNLFQADASFNGPIGTWNTARVAKMAHMFQGATSFNQPIGTWNTVSVTDMSQMFYFAGRFNQPIDRWNVARVTGMSQMFSEAGRFNQPLDPWNVARVTDMKRMFSGAVQFSQPIQSWNVARVTGMLHMFSLAERFNQPLDNWNVASVTDMKQFFFQAERFNQPIGRWNVARVKSMSYMFYGAGQFNQPIGSWNVASVTSLRSMFYNAERFNQPIGSWDVARVTSMSSMLYGAKQFNQPIGRWIVASATDMNQMFRGTGRFNQPIGSWNIANVADMSYMFYDVGRFNQPIDRWNVARVSAMSHMFFNAARFNQPIDCWNVAAVMNMDQMFTGAAQYCCNISAWSSTLAFPDAMSSLHSSFSSCVSNCKPSASPTSSPTSTMTLTAWASATTSTTTTTMLITTTLTTMASGITASASSVMEGSYTFRVSNVSQFMNEPDLTEVMATAIASMLHVNISWVQDVRVTLLQTRRLGLAPDGHRARVGLDTFDRQLATFTFTTRSSVKVDFSVVVPPHGPAHVTAIASAARFDSMTLQEASRILDKVLKTSFATANQRYIVDIHFKTARMKVSTTPSPQKSKSIKRLLLLFPVVSVLIGFICFGSILLFYVRYRKFWKREQRKRLANIPLEERCSSSEASDVVAKSVSELAFPPPAISKTRGEELRKLLSGMIDATSAKVFITFAIDQRMDDAVDSGPGLYYAAATAKTLYAHGMACYLYLPQLTDKATCFQLLSDKDKFCKVLVIVESPAVYKCEQCFAEIRIAQENGIEIIRLRFEDGSPCSSGWWRTLPDPVPFVVQHSPSILENLASNLKCKLTAGAGSPISSATPASLLGSELAHPDKAQTKPEGLVLEPPEETQRKHSSESAEHIESKPLLKSNGGFRDAVEDQAKMGSTAKPEKERKTHRRSPRAAAAKKKPSSYHGFPHGPDDTQDGKKGLSGTLLTHVNENSPRLPLRPESARMHVNGNSPRLPLRLDSAPINVSKHAVCANVDRETPRPSHLSVHEAIWVADVPSGSSMASHGRSSSRMKKIKAVKSVVRPKKGKKEPCGKPVEVDPEKCGKPCCESTRVGEQ